MKKYFSIYFLIVVSCMSCRSKLNSRQFNAYEDRYFAAYATNDVNGAEKSLQDGLNWVSQCEREHTVIGIDLEATKASFHERLFLIYQDTHQTNKMKSELQQSMDCLNRSRLSQGLSVLTNENDLAEKLQNLDAGKTIVWKTNVGKK